MDGALSSFELIEADRHTEVVENIPTDVAEVFGSWTHVAKLYPEMPGSWLFGNEKLAVSPESIEYSLGLLKRLVVELYRWREEPAALVNLFMIGRIGKGGRLRATDAEAFEGFDKYPNLPTEEKLKTEATIRAMALAFYSFEHEDTSWHQHFWMHNMNISVCEFSERTIAPGLRDKAAYAVEKWSEAISDFRREQEDLLGAASGDVAIDLWTPERQEVLMGLLARQFQTTVALLRNINNWQQSSGSHFIRSLVENLITIHYLESAPKLYDKFREYGLGQLKLYKLHLQELEGGDLRNDSAITQVIDDIEEWLAEDISEEMLTVNLGNWDGKTLRQMAKLAGQEDLYKLVYQRRSIDAHSMWSSIAIEHLARCLNPLHRGHRMPVFGQSPADPGLPFQAMDLFEMSAKAIGAALKVSVDVTPITRNRQVLNDLLIGPSKDLDEDS